MANNIKWKDVLLASCNWAEKRFNLKLELDGDIVDEVADSLEKSLKLTDLDQPNVAKIAGHTVFWIRKLKPVHHKDSSPNKLLAINEVIGVRLGFSICRKYFDDHADPAPNKVHTRLLSDLVKSLRAHSHSPHSTALLFEQIFTCR